MNKIGLVIFSSTNKFEELKKVDYVYPVQLGVFFEDIKFEQEETLDELFKFYETTKIVPRTSQPSTGEIIATYEEAFKSCEQLIVIGPDPTLSGTLSNATLAAQEFVGKIKVLSSGSIAPTEYIVIKEAIRLIDANNSFDDVVKAIEELVPKIDIYVTPGQMSFLKRSGRVNLAQLVVGNLVQLKLIIRQSKRELPYVFTKCRGTKVLMKEFEKIIVKSDAKALYFANIYSDLKYKEAIKKICERENVEFIDTGDASIIAACQFGPESFGFSIVLN